MSLQPEIEEDFEEVDSDEEVGVLTLNISGNLWSCN